MAGRDVQIDLRAALPVAALAVVVLVIIFVELCGREEVKAPEQVSGDQPTATAGPTFTPGPSPTPGEEPTEQPPGGAETRDLQRQDDLLTVQAALEGFRADHGNYPSTSGNIQTLCVFEDADVGCGLREFLDPLPGDPLGDPGRYGYYFRSTDNDYTLFAFRESDAVEECPEHPDHLSQLDSVMCIQGP
jgi:hypothetical protein